NVKQAIVKLNEGASGDGNASVDLCRLPAPGAEGEAEALAERVRQMSFESTDISFAAYVKELEQRGGVVEQRIVAGEVRSPSVQLRITPVGDGEVELLSTHDQLLGGPSGQKYLGCRFPADPAYAVAITEEAAKIGAVLAREGVMGR